MPLLLAIVLLLLLLTGGTWGSAALYADVDHAPFELGVASGEPSHHSVVIWTKLYSSAHALDDQAAASFSAAGSGVDLSWQVWWLADNTSHVAKQGLITPNSSAQWNTLVLVDGLQPDTTYYYQFTHLGSGNHSVIGRTRTSSSANAIVKVATVSCSSIWSGYMNSYDRLAERDDLDVVFHLGDFIYPELDKTNCARVPTFSANSGCTPQGECKGETLPASQQVNVTRLAMQRNCSPSSSSALDRFRWVYTYYLHDPMLRRLRQQQAMVVMFDNHDVGSSKSEDVNAGEIRAFLEYVPLLVGQDQENESNGDDGGWFYRQFKLGDGLVNAMALDTRNIGQPVSYLGENQTKWVNSTLVADAAVWRLVLTTTAFSPWVLNGWDTFMHFFFGITLLLACLSASLCCLGMSVACRNSTSAQTVKEGDAEREDMLQPAFNDDNSPPRRGRCSWRRCCSVCWVVLIVIIAALWIAVFAVVKHMASARHIALTPQPGRAFIDADRGTRSWSGNPGDRLLFVDQLLATNHSLNNVFASGDLHMSLAADVRRVDPAVYDSLAHGQRVGVEVLSSSVTRNNLDEILRKFGVPGGAVTAAAANLAVRLLQTANPHFHYIEPTEHGYAVLEFTPSQVSAEYWHTPTVVASDIQWLAKRVTCQSGTNTWVVVE